MRNYTSPAWWREMSKLCAAASERHTSAVESTNCPLERSPQARPTTIAALVRTESRQSRRNFRREAHAMLTVCSSAD